jgi:hypothetical protein
MHLLTKITMLLIVASTIMDFTTTEYLLYVGHLTKGDVIIKFYEHNYLFAILGHLGFILFSVCMVALLFSVLFIDDKVCVKNNRFGLLFFGCLVATFVYVIPHFYLGWSNWQLIQNYIL